MNTSKLLSQLFPNSVCSIYWYSASFHCRDFLVICLKYRNPLLVKLLANSILYDAAYFIDEFGSDNLSLPKRFKIYTYFRNVSNFSIILVSPLSFYNAFINTVESTFLGSNWSEREIYDIYGIYFYDHSDLRRILTDYGFEGFPLRKDFPVNGYFQIRYDETFKRIVSEPVELTQEYRFFTFRNPWQTGF